jgi:hypothetical protein
VPDILAAVARELRVDRVRPGRSIWRRCFSEDPELGRAALRRWLHDGVIRVGQSPDGMIPDRSRVTA